LLTACERLFKKERNSCALQRSAVAGALLTVNG
jgi:hypothetical protein